jgi:hypothetical protein
MTDIPQSLTGLSDVLWGEAGGGDKSGKALSIQQAAAMGIIGLPFRHMKLFYSKMMEQAIRCASRNRTEDFQMGIPDEHGQIETVQVRIEQLLGKVRVYPDSDENYPESWISKRNTYLQLMMEANTDPTLKAIVSSPQNQNMGKKLIGLQELIIPDADSWTKQEVEINILLTEPFKPPQPSPPQQMPNPMMPHIMETIQPPPIPAQSSVPIDPIYDNHAAELLTVTNWINGIKGQRAKKENPTGFENVRLHGLEHKQALMAQMPPPPPPPTGQKPPAPHAAPPPGGAPPSSKPAPGNGPPPS